VRFLVPQRHFHVSGHNMATTHNNPLSDASSSTIFAVQGGEVLIPAPTLASELGIARRTLARWWDDPKLGFPHPTRINRRLFFSRSAVEEWKAARLRQAREAA